MNRSRRQVLHLATAAGMLPALAQLAFAQAYPSRVVRIVVGYPAGLAPDIIARIIAQPLSERLGQQAIVDDRPGAGSNIAAELVVRSPPDGYTLLAVTFANAVNARLYQGLTFDILRDIAPVVGTFRSALVMTVTPSFPASTVAEFVAYAKANPGKVNYASAGHGTVNNMAGELFKSMTGVDLVHVPYRGSYLADLISGQVHVAFAPIGSVIEQIRADKLRAIAVTDAARLDALPGIPTVTESVPGYEASVWHGIGASRDTPPAIIDRLNHEINAVLADPKTQARFGEFGGSVIGGSPADFGKLIADETEKWGRVIRFAHITPE
jgi:tripartite-type tricarboxylate transporter receptor subunit TctC